MKSIKQFVLRILAFFQVRNSAISSWPWTPIFYSSLVPSRFSFLIKYTIDQPRFQSKYAIESVVYWSHLPNMVSTTWLELIRNGEILRMNNKIFRWMPAQMSHGLWFLFEEHTLVRPTAAFPTPYGTLRTYLNPPGDETLTISPCLAGTIILAAWHAAM